MVLSLAHKRNIANGVLPHQGIHTGKKLTDTRETLTNDAGTAVKAAVKGKRCAQCAAVKCNCAAPAWESDDNVVIEMMPNERHVRAGNAKARKAELTIDILQTSQGEGGDFFGENEPQSSNIYQQQQQGRRRHSDVFANSMCGNYSFSQFICDSPLRVLCGGDNNTSRQFSGAQHQHNQGHQQHHQNNHGSQSRQSTNKKVVGPSRRFYRRRGFGDAPAEAGRRKSLETIFHLQQNSVLSSLCLPSRGRKQQQQQPPPQQQQPGRRRWSGDQECRSNFHVPLPRSRARLPGAQDEVTPLAAEGGCGGALGAEMPFGAPHNVSGSEFCCAAEEGSTCDSSFLSNNASLYGVAIEKLLIECEQRAINARRAHCVVSGNTAAGTNCFNKQLSPTCSVSNTRLFDGQSSLGYSSFSLSPSKTVSGGYSLLTETECKSGEFSLGQDTKMDEPSDDICAALGDLCTEKEQLGSEEVPYEVLNGGLFRFFGNGEAGEIGTYSTIVQKMLQDISTRVKYGDAGPLVLIGALVYVSRIATHCLFSYSSLTSVNCHHLVAIAILLATKMHVDVSWSWNEQFAEIINLSLKEVNKLELDFLFLVDFNLLVKEEELDAWTKWIDFIAHQCGMLTSSREFTFGKGGFTLSKSTTPFSSFAGGDNFSPTVTSALAKNNCHPISLPLASADVTSSSKAHISPAASRPSNFSGGSSISFAQNTSERKNCASQKTHSLSTPLMRFCETPNSLRLSQLQTLPLAHGAAGRLFSVVHAPQEPTTPPRPHRLPLKISNETPSDCFVPTPPGWQNMSPVAFFKRSFSVERGNGDAEASGRRKSDGGVSFFSPSFDELDDGRTPPNRLLNVLSPPISSKMATFCPITVERDNNGTSVNYGSSTALMNSAEGVTERNSDSIGSLLIGG